MRPRCGSRIQILKFSRGHWLGTQPAVPPEDNVLAVLRERYIRGEIDDEEFDRRRGGLWPRQRMCPSTTDVLN
ncbi:SHOCT domain-containing protein [Halobacterium hubeiense]|uniref:SHOCT domain-containing protein n=1 Tax=Halobacterium hubeiense TaxID=1407499 RepID=UPI0009E96762|nr:SHOCT domain-containing protein [Halobacterium hubeiense]